IFGLLAVLPGRALEGQRGAGTDAPPLTEGAGVISGVVVDGTTQQPIPGAVVSISGLRLTTVPIRGTRQITDDKGRFAFTRLPAGLAYSLTATKFGYFDGAYGRRAPQGNVSRRIALSENQWFPDATIQLWRPASISGAVVDEAGEPMVGILVRAYIEILVGGVAHAASSVITRTDDRGVYRLANLAEGKYVVMVPSVQHAVPASISLLDLSGTTPEMVASAETAGREAPLRRDPLLGIDRDHRLVAGPYPTPPPTAGGKPQAYPPTYYPSARTFERAEAIRVRSGEDRMGVDLRLQPVPTSRILGRLAGPGDAIGGVTLRLVSAGSDALGRGTETATTLTAADGAFTFLNVPRGQYTIVAAGSVSEYEHRVAFATSVELPRLPAQRGGGMSSSAVFSGPAGTFFTNRSNGGEMRHFGRQQVTVAEADVMDVVVTMNTGVTISGRIEVGPRQPDAPPSPTVPLSVGADPANGDPALGQTRARTRTEGDSTEFTIAGLQPGQYLIRLLGRTLKSVTWDGKDYTYTPFDTSAGRNFTDVVITLTSQVTTLNGVVRDRSGQVEDNAAVIYFPVEQAQWTNFGVQPTRLRSVATSTAGAFTLRTLPAGEYYLIAVDGDLIDAWKDPAFLAAAARLATRISIDWGETKTQDLVLQQVR
ncbi:MAG TPA: carboxypeptidase regulatory-like domain-containing protein, partial [Vicinamibacterales bacterium]